MGRRACLILLPLALTSPAAATVPKEPLGHDGRWITDAKGRVVMFHGAAVTPDGFVDKPFETAEEAGFRKADARLLSRHGFNLVRLAAFHGAYEREPGQFTESYMDSFVRTQRLLARHGIFTLFDFHQDMLNPRYQGRGFADWFIQDDGFPNIAPGGLPGQLLRQLGTQPRLRQPLGERSGAGRHRRAGPLRRGMAARGGALRGALARGRLRHPQRALAGERLADMREHGGLPAGRLRLRPR